MQKTTVVYHQVYQNFTEMDEEGNILKEGSFKIPDRVETIIENEKATILFLNDGSKGVSLCHPNDRFNLTTGRKLAYLRAKIVSLGKEIKQVLKDTHNK